MPSFIKPLTLHTVELELDGRPAREIDLMLILDTDAQYRLGWPGADGILEVRRSGHSIRLKLHLKSRERLCHLFLHLTVSSEPARMLCNGYNDWTASREYHSSESQGRLRIPVRWLLYPYTDIPVIEKRLRTGRGAKRSHAFTVLRTGQRVLLLGSVCDFDAFTFFEFDGRSIFVHRDVEGRILQGEETVLDLYIEEGYESDLETLYQNYFALKNLPPLRTNPAAGYTSWYYHYNHVTPDDLFRIIEQSEKTEAPLDVIQIDDGFQRRVGDWLDLKPEFGSSLRPIVDRIHRAGYRAGLWLAPFIAEARSSIVREHPDWIARDRRGHRIRAGYNPLWSYWFYALDLKNPEVREYLTAVFRVVLQEWDFDLLKLDFLYAAALQEPQTMSRAQLLSDGIQLIHEATGWKAGHKFTPDKKNGPLLLGCGIPLSSAEGRFDYCRIGSDVKESWEDEFLRKVNYQERVSTYNSLISTISRHPYNGRGFWNDPDVFYLRHTFRALKEIEKSMPLPMNQAEKATLLLINHALGGLIFTSDPVHEYNEQEQSLYSRCFPLLAHRIDSVTDDERLYMIRFTGQIIDRPLNYLIVSNLRNREAEIDLPEGLWFRSCVHSTDISDIPDASWMYTGRVSLKPHHSLCLLRTGELAGTTGHIFPAGDLLSVDLNGTSGPIHHVERRNRSMPVSPAYLVLEADCKLAGSANPVRQFRAGQSEFVVLQYG